MKKILKHLEKIIAQYQQQKNQHIQIIIFLIVKNVAVLATNNNFRFESPCNFPSPNLINFGQICQLDYHQIPYLCDPTGMLSRTETELIDRKIQRQLRGHQNLSGCVCLNNFNINSEEENMPESCQRQFKFPSYYSNRSLKVVVIMVPYSSVNR